MSISSKIFSNNIYYPVLYILLNSLFLSENAFSLNYWKRDFTKIMYNSADNSILINFKVYDYYLGAKKYCISRAYLKLCDFYFTSDGKIYAQLFRVESKYQILKDCTKLQMRLKNHNAELLLLGTDNLENAFLWHDSHTDLTVEARNDSIGQVNIFKYNKELKVDKYSSFFTVKWCLGENFRFVYRIKLHGIWKVSGYNPDIINDVNYDLPGRRMLKSVISQSENNLVKVVANTDVIVITGAEIGENIKVYNAVGVEVHSSVTKRDVVNIKLPKSQIYNVNIGQDRYKVAL